MGNVNPECTEWEHISAINRERLVRIADKWMLPASHFIVYKSPNDAAKRVLKEQLGLKNLELKGPFAYSEVYDIERANIINNWDLEFVYTGELEKLPSRNPAWKELSFVDVKTVQDKDFARNHQDILANLGIRKAG
jgi:isopentenyldiphosphate isomerase